MSVDVKLHAFLTSALDGGERSSSPSGRFIPLRKLPAVLTAQKTVDVPVESRGLIVLTTVSHFTDWAIKTHLNMHEKVKFIKWPYTVQVLLGETGGIVIWTHNFHVFGFDLLYPFSTSVKLDDKLGGGQKRRNMKEFSHGEMKGVGCDRLICGYSLSPYKSEGLNPARKTLRCKRFT
jgi:hypothetical protein